MGQVAGLEAQLRDFTVRQKGWKPVGREALNLEDVEIGSFGTPLVDVAEVRGKDRSLTRDEKVTGGTGEAGQVAAVLSLGDQDGVEPILGQSAAQAFDARDDVQFTPPLLP